MNSSQTFALAMAPPALTFIMLRLGWRSMFVLLGVLGIVVAFAWLLLYRERKDTIWRDTEIAPQMSESATKALLRQRTVWGMMLGWGGINYTAWLYLAWLPGYLQEQRHLSISQSGWLTSLPFLAGALGMYLCGFVADRLAISGVPLARIHRYNLVLGMSVSAACTLLVAICHSTLEAVAGISLALFAIHYAGTSGWGYVQTIAPLRLVVSLGALQNFAGFLIASAAPVVTGWLLDRSHSFGMALSLCSVVTLLGALSYATLAKPDGLRFSEADISTRESH
jgi:cyanate permease